ncbi:MAG: metal ABC transporter permease, partial [Paracoccaceae bacterium]|nr:metal ABC transporter permease [Paracoccaceae bacterium]
MAALLEPFGYNYMFNAMWVSALVGAVCAFLSAYLMLKGWSLIGDALSHSIVPGVAGAYMLGLPFALGAFAAGGLAAGAMLFLNQRSGLKEDTIIGLIFTSFFGLGLFKKVIIADSFAYWADAGFRRAEALSFFEAWSVSLSYT